MGDWRLNEETLSAIHPYIWFRCTNLITIRRTDNGRVKGMNKFNSEPQLPDFRASTRLFNIVFLVEETYRTKKYHKELNISA